MDLKQKKNNSNNSLIKILRLCCIVLIFSSCLNRTSELNDLRKENKILLSQIESLKSNKDNLIFKTIVQARSNKIRLGEEYIAGVSMAVIDTLNPPIVVLSEEIDGQSMQTKDTLDFSSQYYSSLYRITPEKTGTYSWSGTVYYNHNGETIKGLFFSKYIVVD